MTRLEFVACHIREALHAYEIKKHGNYSIYIAKVAMAAHDAPIPEQPVEPAPTNILDDLFA